MLMARASGILPTGFQVCNDVTSSLESLLQVLDMVQPYQTSAGSCSLDCQELRFDMSSTDIITEYEQLEAAITVCSHVKCLPAAETV